MLSHGNLMSCATEMSRVLSIGPSDRLLSVLPLSHLYEQVLGFIGPMMVGASVVYPVSRQPAVLVRTFRDFKVTILLIVPQGLQLLTNAIERKVDQQGQRARFEQLHDSADDSRCPCGGCSSGRSWRSSVDGSTRSGSARRRSSSTWRSAGSTWASRSCRATVRPRWARSSRSRGRSGTSSGRSGSRYRGSRSGSPTTARSSPAARAGSSATGRTPRRRPSPSMPRAGITRATSGAFTPAGMLTFRGRKKDMLALPDGQKVYPEDVEAVLRADPRVGDATVVGWPPGGSLRVHAVLLLEDPSVADDVVATANARARPTSADPRHRPSGPTRTCRRTHTLKVRKPEVLARLAALESPDRRRWRRPPGAHGPRSDAARGPDHGDRGQRRRPRSRGRATTARLSSDLNLDSLRRVELLGVVEEELGVFVDDDALEPDATVADLIALVEAARETRRKPGSWAGRSARPCGLVGLASQVRLIYPFIHLFYRCG